MNNINNQKLIYFYSPMGTWTRINKNLIHLGLDKNKKIGNTYARDFIWEVKNNTYKKKYKNIDVIYLDEFYDFEFDNEELFAKSYDVMKELIESGKQIVMAGHNELDTFNLMPEEMKKNIISYDLIYGLDGEFDSSIKYLD